MALTCSPALWANADDPTYGRLRVDGPVEHLGDVVADGGEPLEPAVGEALVAELELQVGDDRREVGVARALAEAVQRALHVTGAGAHRGHRVGDRAAGVVVAVDADHDVARRRGGSTSATIASISWGSDPPLVSHSTTWVAPLTTAASSARSENSGALL